MRDQQTIDHSVTCTGVGLHTGQHATLRLHPAPADHGIVFKRSDLGRSAPIRAAADLVVSTSFSTTLGRDRNTVQTVEHLLAACAGLRIDNLLIDVNGPEVPILDGSAEPFVSLLRHAGISPQGRVQPYMRLIRPLHIGRPGRGIVALPAPFPKISYAIDFPDDAVRRQHYLYEWTEAEFVREIAPARTFGFVKDVERMRAMGLIKGASLDNAVVVGERGVMNPGGLRFADEFVRHKVLDLIGDLSLTGLPLVAHVIADCAGHTMNLELVRQLMAQTDAWVTVTPDAEEVPALDHAAPPLPVALPLPL
jgi:UDP-3-O-[3-hydroxymyristoyl] N-acetylglucosamine deacetylase